MQKKVVALRLYLIQRTHLKPYRILVIARSPKEAENITNKRFGHSTSYVSNKRMRRGIYFELEMIY